MSETSCVRPNVFVVPMFCLGSYSAVAPFFAPYTKGAKKMVLSSLDVLKIPSSILDVIIVAPWEKSLRDGSWCMVVVVVVTAEGLNVAYIVDRRWSSPRVQWGK